MKKGKLFILLFILFLFHNSPAIRQHSAGSQLIQEGKASYYGREFNGRKTANGEIFDNSDFTAAHRTLPFHTLLRVTNVDNDLSVTVRVNDRGPYVKNRIIDLTESAARRTGSYHKGLSTVRIEKLNLLRRTPAIDSIFTCWDIVNCLGEIDRLEGYSLKLWSTSDLLHMLYVANDLYIQEDIEKVLIVGNGIGDRRKYSMVVTGIKNKAELNQRKDYFERKGFMRVSELK